MDPQQYYAVRWNDHHRNLQTMFPKLLERGCFCDVTLACEGQTIRAHRIILCASSPFFENVLTASCYGADKEPIIIVEDARYEDMKRLVEFMYKGEINVEHSVLERLLRAAEKLRIRGMAVGACFLDGAGNAAVDFELERADGADGAGGAGGEVGSVSSTATVGTSYGDTGAAAVDSTAAPRPSAPQGASAEPGGAAPPAPAGNCTSSSSSGSGSNSISSGGISATRNNLRITCDTRSKPSDNACSTLGSNSRSLNNHDSSLARVNASEVVGNSRPPEQDAGTPPSAPDIISDLTAAGDGASGSSTALTPPQGFAPFVRVAMSNNYLSEKRKRGRPPLDDEYRTFQPVPKLAHADARAAFSLSDANAASGVVDNHDPSGSCCSSTRTSVEYGHRPAATEEAAAALVARRSHPGTRSAPPTDGDEGYAQQSWEASELPPSECSVPERPVRYAPISLQPFAFEGIDDRSPPSPSDDPVVLTPAEQEQWKDVVKMQDYVSKGRRPLFWEEPFTRRVLDGIRKKTLEMKKAAKILGVSYGTLYGRYRETYGCLKHPNRGPTHLGARMRELWHTNGNNSSSSSEIINMQRADPPVPEPLFSSSPSAIIAFLDHQQQDLTTQLSTLHHGWTPGEEQA